MSLFKTNSSIGIHIGDREITCIELIPEGASCKVISVSSIALEKGIVESGVILKPELLSEHLSELRKRFSDSNCMVSLPVNKSYSIVSDHPFALEEEEIRTITLREANGHVPVPIEELNYELAIVEEESVGLKRMFFTGIEKVIVDVYKEILITSGWEPCFVMDSVALGHAVPVRWSEHPFIVILLNMGTETLMVAIYQGYFFDGVVSDELKKDFTIFFEAVAQELAASPSHVILSGPVGSFDEIQNLGFEEKSHFVSAKELEFQNLETEVTYGVLLASGLARFNSLERKKIGAGALALL